MKKRSQTSTLVNKEYEQKSFAKFFIGILIVFIGFISAIFILSGNDEFFVKHFGEDSQMTQIFRKLSQGNKNKEHADFTLPFGLRRQNILFLGVDASENPDDIWTGTRTDTIDFLRGLS